MAAEEHPDNPRSTVALDLAADYFNLFALERSYDVDMAAVATRFRTLQSELHPDRHVAGSAAERRWSMQASSYVNDAHDTLRRPLKRAVYLLSLAGISTDEETDTRMDPMFLMEQMELREAIESAPVAADPYASLRAVSKQLIAATATEEDSFRQASDAGQWDKARDVVRRWQFLDKLAREVSALEARLDDEAS